MLPDAGAEVRSEGGSRVHAKRCGCMHTGARAVLTVGPDAQGNRDARTRKRAAGSEMRNANGESRNLDFKMAEAPEWKLGGLHS